MTDTARGLAYCFTFLVLEAAQAVYFGGVFQGVSSFLVGALVFGTTSLSVLTFVAVRSPGQFALIYRLRREVALVNLLTAVAFVAFFMAIQMIEPAIASTLFSGALPLAVIAAASFGVPYAEPIGSRSEGASYLALTASLVFLLLVTVLDLSGFVRGSALHGLIGALLTLLSGASISIAVILCRRMNARGLAPATQFGVRFVLYAVMSAGFAIAGVDAKGPVSMQELAIVYVVGLIIIATPIYAFQRAVPFLSAQTIAVVTALGPLIVFGLQMVEGRVDFAPATLLGLIFYCISALAIAGSSAWAARRRVIAAG